jgi:hypothetical protein
VSVDLSAPETDELRSAADECAQATSDFEKEADKNQALAWYGSLVVVVSSALIPVLIVISTTTDAFLFGRLLPAVLATLAPITAGYTQIVRPHDRWHVNRRWQRRLQLEQFCYRHRLGRYASSDRDRLLLEQVAEAQRSNFEEWEAMMPPNTRGSSATLRNPPSRQ